SSGIHSNGFSLVRKVVKNLDLYQTYSGFTRPLGEVLLTPTKIYAKSVRQLFKNLEVKGISHLTGGGFYENFPRMLPPGLGVELDQTAWKIPEIFKFIQEKGKIADRDMYGVFNMGVGMAVVVSKEDAHQALTTLQIEEENAAIIGTVVDSKGVHFTS